MAAPTIPAGQRKANLNALLSRDNTPKVTRKNVLCPASQEWPRAPKTVEESILAKLTEKLTSVVNVFKSTKKSLAEDKLEKVRIRSQLEIGASSVFRALERDTLTCILISGQATPALAVDHIISLGQERGCPLLCLDQLASSISSATNSKCLPLAIGFKKMEDNSQSDFAEIISLVKENVTTHTPVKTHFNLTNVASTGHVTRTKTHTNIPIRINTDVEKEILEELKRIFTGALVVVSIDKDKNVKKKQKKKKRNLKDAFDRTYHCQFDVGKRTVTGILERDKIQLILISEEIVPILLSETQPGSLLSVAAMKKCPVVVLPGLVDAMRALCGGNVSVLGLKKINSLQDDQRNFKQIVDKCLEAVTSSNTRLSQPENLTEVKTKTGAGNEGQSLLQEHQEEPVSRNDIHTDEITQDSAIVDKSNLLTNKGIPGVNDDSAELKSDNDDPDDDYSYLYVMKKDSKEFAEVKDELKTIVESSQKDAFSGDYIALSSRSDDTKSAGSKSSRKRKVGSDVSASKRLGIGNSNSAGAGCAGDVQTSSDNLISFTELRTPAGQDVDSGISKMDIDSVSTIMSPSNKPDLPLFTLCRSGDNKTILQKEPQNTETFSDKSRKDELGVKELPAPKDKKPGIDYFSLAETGKNAKTTTKRKLQNDDSYISFAYTESNIRTMTSNPSKKKKKRKKNKV